MPTTKYNPLFALCVLGKSCEFSSGSFLFANLVLDQNNVPYTNTLAFIKRSMENYMIIGLIILTIGHWFWAIIDLTKSLFKKTYLKTIWFLIVLLFPILGSILYFQMKNRMINKRRRKFQPNFNKSRII